MSFSIYNWIDKMSDVSLFMMDHLKTLVREISLFETTEKSFNKMVFCLNFRLWRKRVKKTFKFCFSSLSSICGARPSNFVDSTIFPFRNNKSKSRQNFNIFCLPDISWASFPDFQLICKISFDNIIYLLFITNSDGGEKTLG